MKKQETIESFYGSRKIMPKGAALFNIFKNQGYCTEPHIYNRRDYYKISLLQGKSRLTWHHRDIDIDRPALIFFNPLTPFAWSPLSDEQPGYFCLFKKEFLKEAVRDESLQQSPLFKAGGDPMFFPDKAQLKYLDDLFGKMMTEIASDYLYKYDLLRSYLQLVIHEALKMKPEQLHLSQKNAAERITGLFLELLERQFPIDTPDRSLELRTAGDYARSLSVHANHLNHAVKTVTGSPTSVHIAGRVIAEAKALLKHTDWPVAQIAYSLGFAYPNYFHNFFRRQTGYAAGQYRSGIV